MTMLPANNNLTTGLFWWS